MDYMLLVALPITFMCVPLDPPTDARRILKSAALSIQHSIRCIVLFFVWIQTSELLLVSIIKEVRQNRMFTANNTSSKLFAPGTLQLKSVPQILMWQWYWQIPIVLQRIFAPEIFYYILFIDLIEYIKQVITTISKM